MSSISSYQPEDVIFELLHTQYPIYRNSLSDPTVLPVDTEILWGAPKSEIMTHSFVVVRSRTDRNMPFLGQPKVKNSTTCVARFATTWTQFGKPVVIDQFERFLEFETATNVNNSFYKNKGFAYVIPGTSSSVVEPRDPENDQWVLNFEIYTEQLKSY